MAQHDVSNSEIVRRLESIEAELFRSRTFVRQDVYQESKEDIDRRLTALEEAQRAAFRMLIAAFFGLLVEGALIAIRTAGG